MILGREPVLVLALLQALIALMVGFGLQVTAEQLALIESFAAALLGFIARQRVTPLGRPRTDAPTGGTVVPPLDRPA